MPDGTERSRRKPTFNTLDREESFRNPPKNGSTYNILNEFVAPHIESFNALFDDSGLPSGDGDGRGILSLALKEIGERVAFDRTGQPDSEGGTGGWGNRMRIWIDQVTIARPMVSEKDRISRERRVFPSEARERLTSYRGRMTIKLCWTDTSGQRHEVIKECGLIPIMVRSVRCNIRSMSSAELVRHHEEPEEFGGYFVINGNERLIRYLILPRRNHVISLLRPSFANRGPSYTQYAVQIRCVRPDQTSVTNTLHYLSNGSAMLRFSWRKQEYVIPIMLVLKALVDASDKEIFQGVMMEDYENTFLTDRLELLLRSFKMFTLKTGDQCLEYLGDKFRIALNLPEDLTNIAVGAWLVQKVVLVHLSTPRDKFRMLLFMLRKLYALVSGSCCADNPDSPQYQEVLLPGSLYGMIIKEKMEEILNNIRTNISIDVRNGATVDFNDKNYFNKVLSRVNFDIGAKLSNFLATGNLVSPTGLDLQQASGFTIVAEKLNWQRYISHFRCIHRGAFFAELKTTTVRKLLPEAWGFLCPVHTPDGSPCGLLNHLSHTCRIVTSPLPVAHIPTILTAHGMTQPFTTAIDGRKNFCVQLDGRVIGWARPAVAAQLATNLRIWKTEGAHDIPLDLEVGFISESKGGQYPGLYLFSTKARMMRPVKYIANGRNDQIGSFEQVYMNIACTPEEIELGVSTHVEHVPTNFLSILANLTPFSDFNQSPRNIYQCQMGKQTMGTPSTALKHRTDNKLYRLQSGQSPVVRPALHNTYAMDAYPNGTNAIVAVISYTGYDMEDAMILNKSAHERGFAYGTVYKSQIVDLKEIRGAGKSVSAPTLHFGLGSDIRLTGEKAHACLAFLGEDGLPCVGTRLVSGDPIAAYIDDTTGRTRFVKYKGDESGFVDEVRLLGSDAGDTELQRIHITLRITRAPVIGDKFSSRHGQKGVCSQKWPAIDMPFSESGMQPDIIINPHAFPSRMTIGMLVESMAGKAGAMHGLAQDATPFQFSEEDTAIDYFGQQLLAAGYNYYGNEPMYSGITGKEFAADIYIGVVYYQRLRHMVLDKFQVRTTGPVDPVTRQPVKGRKRAGGIRFGEMERDALIAHGTSFLLQDRLMNCSDYSTAWVCRTCGSLISLGYDDISLGEVSFGESGRIKPTGPGGEYCRVCRAAAESEDERERQSLATGQHLQRPRADVQVAISSQQVLSGVSKGGNLDVVAVPYVFRYLCAELASMGINVSVCVSLWSFCSSAYLSSHKEFGGGTRSFLHTMKLVTFIFIASAIFDGLLSASCQQSQIPLFGRPVLGEHNKLISPETSAFIKDILSRWNSSGLSVAVVRKDEHESSGWRHEFGSYGIATGDEAPVTPDTVFAIASNSKLFLALSVGLLISNETLAKERGAPIKWNTKISDLIPEWGLMDQDMGKAVTIQDMLSHRTGMPRHDYSLSPHGNGNVSEMISTLRYLTPSAEIRETFQYNNRMYETLSYLPTVLLNQTYESYVAQHLTGPLGMTSTTYSVGEAESSGNFAHGFAWHMRDFTKGLYGTLKPIIPFVFRPGEEFIWSGSGGVLSSAKDLATWVSMLLNEGRHPTTNKTVVPESVVTHVATGVSVSAGIAPYPELSPKTYGGGQWRYSYQGHEVVEHGGSIHGFKTMVARFPNDNLGIVILSNDENGSKIYPIILWRIAGELLGLKQVDWNSRLEKEFKEEVAKAQEFTPRPSSPLPPSAPLVTLTHKRFEHPTYGELMLCAVPQTQPEFIEQSPECASFLDSQAVQQIVNASDVSIPTFIVPYKKSFATHLRLSHFSGDIFNVTAIWTNADMLYGLDDNYNAEWFLGDNNGEEGLAFSGNFFGKEGQVSKAPEGKGKYGAEVWFSRS